MNILTRLFTKLSPVSIYTPLKRPRFDPDPELEQRQKQARRELGDIEPKRVIEQERG